MNLQMLSCRLLTPHWPVVSVFAWQTGVKLKYFQFHVNIQFSFQMFLFKERERKKKKKLTFPHSGKAVQHVCFVAYIIWFARKHPKAQINNSSQKVQKAMGTSEPQACQRQRIANILLQKPTFEPQKIRSSVYNWLLSC